MYEACWSQDAGGQGSGEILCTLCFRRWDLSCTQHLLVCLRGFIVHESWNTLWKNPSVPGMRAASAALLPVVHLASLTFFPWVSGIGTYSDTSPQGPCPGFPVWKDPEPCAVPDSWDTQILASSIVKPLQMGFTVLETTSSVQLIPALYMCTWYPYWQAAQVL